MSNHAASSAVYCSYALLDHDIHELTFTTNTAAAVESFMLLLNRLFDEKTARDPVLRVLVDGSLAGLPPLGRLMTGAKDLVARHPDRPEVRYAIVLPVGSSQMMTMLESFIRLFRPSNRIRTFSPLQRTAAIAWLLGNHTDNVP